MFRSLLSRARLAALVAAAASAALAQTFGMTQVPLAAGVLQDAANNGTTLTYASRVNLKVPVSYGVPANLAVSYIGSEETVGGQTEYQYEETLQFVLTKTEPVNIYALTYLGTVNPLVTLGAGGGIPFRAYAIAAPRREYGITVTILQGTTVLNSWGLAPEAPVFLDKSSVHQVAAGLEGEAPPPVPAPDLSGCTLYVPDPGVPNWINSMLLVPQEVDPGSSQQLLQMLQADQATLAGNPAAETRYLLNGLWLFRNTLGDMQAKGGLVLETLSPEVCFSTVGMQFDSALLGLSTNRDPGTITAPTLRPFTAGAKNGLLSVTVNNTGTMTVPTSYLVTVTQASNLGTPSPPQACSLLPGQSATLTFFMAGSTPVSGAVSCLVTLAWADGTRSGTGNVIATYPVSGVFP